MFKFLREDPGFCRVYYTGQSPSTGRRMLYCIQNDGVGSKAEYVFYKCSRDGEPEYPKAMPDASQFDRLVFPS